MFELQNVMIILINNKNIKTTLLSEKILQDRHFVRSEFQIINCSSRHMSLPQHITRCSSQTDLDILQEEASELHNRYSRRNPRNTKH
jgi:uncharacterized Fe-S cluster-containing MiaB family protein